MPTDPPTALVSKSDSLVDLLSLIRSEYMGWEQRGREMLRHGVSIGKALATARGHLGHGLWTSWVQKNLPFGERQARRYIKLHEESKAGKADQGQHLEEALPMADELKIHNPPDEKPAPRPAPKPEPRKEARQAHVPEPKEKPAETPKQEQPKIRFDVEAQRIEEAWKVVVEALSHLKAVKAAVAEIADSPLADGFRSKAVAFRVPLIDSAQPESRGRTHSVTRSILWPPIDSAITVLENIPKVESRE